jgi:trans-2-enoyl-CoA reductase
MLAARIHAHGDPAAVLRVEAHEPGAPGPGQARVRMQFAPVNPADLNLIEGTYGRLPALPATVGNEGCGVVEAVGQGVADLRVGDLVRPRDLVGSWCGACVAEAGRFTRLPAGLPPEQAAQLCINPATAWATLDLAPPPPGGWVLCNAPGSAVARSLAALCAARGLRLACLVRRPGEAPPGCLEVPEGREAVAMLKPLGATLALNQVGGESAVLLAKSLAPLGTLVTVGALARQPTALPGGLVIFAELRSVGLWVSRWYERTPAATVAAMLAELAALMASGALVLPVAATYPLAQAVAAIDHARRPGRGGKVLIDCR